MKNESNHWYAKDSRLLQIPYDEYTALIKQLDEAKQLETVKQAVLTNLQQFLDTGLPGSPDQTPVETVPPKAVQERSSDESLVHVPTEDAAVEDVLEEFCPDDVEEQSNNIPASVADSESDAQSREKATELPPIKSTIVDHFNSIDGSGRLFSIFKQYYTCLNETCGGTVRVTMKDGVCSLWNYDAWEEFAFIDIFDRKLRIALDPAYTDELKSLSLCEVSRLIASRRNVICVQVEDLNNIVLDALSKAFESVDHKVK